ncbi:MAG: hypothetical protein OXG27_14545 [Chloroflexi bacterium]|nr:hypothetical protein [Chloroflexota bacterium]
MLRAIDDILTRNELPADPPRPPAVDASGAAKAEFLRFATDRLRALFEQDFATSSFEMVHLAHLSNQPQLAKRLLDSYTNQAPTSLFPAAQPAPSLTLDVELLSDVVRRISWTPECEGAHHPNPEIVMKALEIADYIRAAAEPPLVATTEDGSIILEWQFASGASVELFMEDDTPFPGDVAWTDADDDREIRLENVAALADLLRMCAAGFEPSAH